MFKINLAPAEEGFKEWNAKRKVEKGRRYFSPSQKFGNVEAALSYLNTVYDTDNWPYYVELVLSNPADLNIIVYVRKQKSDMVTGKDIIRCIDTIRSKWKSVMKTALAKFYETNRLDDELDRDVISKNQFIASGRLHGINITGTAGNAMVEYEFDSTLMQEGDFGYFAYGDCPYGEPVASSYIKISS